MINLAIISNIVKIVQTPADQWVYWSGIANKLEKFADMVKEFISLAQAYLWIPTAIVIVIAGFAIYGGARSREWAKTKIFHAVIAVGIVMLAITISLFIIGIFTEGDVSSLSSIDVQQVQQQ